MYKRVREGGVEKRVRGGALVSIGSRNDTQNTLNSAVFNPTLFLTAARITPNGRVY